MATLIDQDFFARLAALNEKFAAGVPDTLARLKHQRHVFDPGAPNPAVLDEIHDILHTIAGSAATFGFRAFGQQARQLEQALRVLKVFDQADQRDWKPWLAAFDEFIAWAEKDARAAHYRDAAQS